MSGTPAFRPDPAHPDYADHLVAERDDLPGAAPPAPAAGPLPLVALARLHSEMRRFQELASDTDLLDEEFIVPDAAYQALGDERYRQRLRVQAAIDRLEAAVKEG